MYTVAMCSNRHNGSENCYCIGIVSDSNKEPLIGVNIIVKDVPGLGAITDINGKYTIKP